MGLPWWLRWLRVCLPCGRPRFNPWVGNIPWRRKCLPTPVLLPGESTWTEEPGGLQSMRSQSPTWLSDFPSHFPVVVSARLQSCWTCALTRSQLLILSPLKPMFWALLLFFLLTLIDVQCPLSNTVVWICTETKSYRYEESCKNSLGLYMVKLSWLNK